jgi:hypothetical protein
MRAKVKRVNATAVQVSAGLKSAILWMRRRISAG